MPRKCSCAAHDQYVAEDEKVNIFKISSHRHPKAVQDVLLRLGHLKPLSTYICSGCIDYVKRNLIKDHSKFGEVFQQLESIKDSLTPEEINQLCTLVGGLVRDNLFQDIQSVSTQYKNSDFLESFSFTDWINSRPTHLLALLQAVTGFDPKQTDNPLFNKLIVVLCRTIENVYHLTSPNIVTPLAFMINMLSYFMSGSKTSHNLHASSSPCGSYTTLQKWLKEGSSKPNVCPPDGSVTIFFDNNQVLQKNGRVMLSFKSQCSVITNIMFINNPDNSIQEHPNLSPYQWLHRLSPNLSIRLQELSNEFQSVLCPVVAGLVSTALVEVRKSIVESTDGLHDEIDVGMVEIDIVTAFKSHDDPYSVHSHHPPLPPQVSLGDPVMVNPAGYDNLKTILDALLTQVGLGNKRAWVCIGCDGAPYNLLARMIEDWFVCPSCSKEIRKGPVGFKEHVTSQHPTELFELNESRMYPHVILLPGAGHIEMNLLKCIFKILWQPYLKHIAILCGFNTPRALLYAKKCTNHHKSWQIFQIFMHASLQELLYQYCISVPLVLPSNDTYQNVKDWVQGSQCDNVKFMWDVLSEWVLPLYIFRCSVRRNNPKLMLASRDSVSTMFYGSGCTTYQEIMFRDERMRVCAPDDVLQYLHHTEVMSASGHPSKGEGGDFVLENQNRRMKMWIPPGVPTEQSWLRSSRTLETLEKMKKNLNEALHIDTDPGFDTVTQQSLQAEIKAFRSWIRSSGHLSTPLVSKPHTGLDRQPLDTDLKSCFSMCRENRQLFRSHAAQGPAKLRMRLKPIFTTPDDRAEYEKPHKRTIPELVEMILSKLDAINANDDLLQEWRDCSKGSKADIVAFWTNIQSLEDAENEEPSPLDGGQRIVSLVEH